MQIETVSSPVALGASALKELCEEVGSLGIRLRVAGNSFQGDDSLPAGGMSVLGALNQHGPQTVPQIARLRGTSRQNIQILVNRLKAEGCVELSENPAHKRSELVQLTASGKDLFTQAAKREAKFLAGLEQRVPEAEVRAAAALLRQLRQILAKGELDTAVADGVAKEGVRDGVTAVTRRKSVAPGGGKKPVRAVVLPVQSEADEGDLPYNLL